MAKTKSKKMDTFNNKESEYNEPDVIVEFIYDNFKDELDKFYSNCKAVMPLKLNGNKDAIKEVVDSVNLYIEHLKQSTKKSNLKRVTSATIDRYIYLAYIFKLEKIIEGSTGEDVSKNNNSKQIVRLSKALESSEAKSSALEIELANSREDINKLTQELKTKEQELDEASNLKNIVDTQREEQKQKDEQIITLKNLLLKRTSDYDTFKAEATALIKKALTQSNQSAVKGVVSGMYVNTMRPKMEDKYKNDTSLLVYSVANKIKDVELSDISDAVEDILKPYFTDNKK